MRPTPGTANKLDRKIAVVGIAVGLVGIIATLVSIAVTILSFL